MKKMKKYIGLLLAIALAGNLCAVNIPVSEVYAQEVEEQTNDAQPAGSTEKSTLSNDEGTEPQVVMEEPQEQSAADSSENSVSVEESAEENTAETEGIKLKGVSIKGNKDVTDLSAPDSFTVEIQADIPEGMGIFQVTLVYWAADIQKSAIFYGYSDRFVSDENGMTMEVDVDISQYAKEASYVLESISFATMYNTIQYNNNSEQLTSADDSIAYNGEIDYKITSSTNVDSSAPEITGIRFMTQGDIYTTTAKIIDVDYEEIGSGVKSISVNYTTGYKDVEFYFTNPPSGEGMLTGSGSVEIVSEGGSAGTYEIDSVVVEDYAGNQTRYIKKDGVDGLVCTELGTILTIPPEAKSFEIQYAKGLKLHGVRIEDGVDKENLTAGDSFNIYLKVMNDSQEDITVRPEYCSVEWGSMDEVGIWQSAYGEGNAFVLEPLQEREITVPVQINPYAKEGIREVSRIMLNNAGDQLTATEYTRNKQEGGFTGRFTEFGVGVGGSGEIETLYYRGEVDYTVTTAETPDQEAPILKGVSVTPNETTAPGTIQIKMKTEGEEVAEVTNATVGFTDINNPKNGIATPASDPSVTKLTYSEKEDCYILEYHLDKVVKGTYRINELTLYDDAGNSRGYYYQDGKLIAWSYETDEEVPEVDACEFTVTESETETSDFDAPVLKGIEVLNPELATDETLRVRIQAEEVSGISSMMLYYSCDSNQDGIPNAYLTLNSKNVVAENDSYVAEFDIDPYCTGGDYDLEHLMITDGSVFEAGSYYYYNKWSNIITNYTDQFSPEKPLTLHIKQSSSRPILDLRTDDLTKAASEVDNRTTLVIKGSYVESVKIELFPAEFWDVVKEKDLTVIIPDSQSNSEIIVNGNELQNIVSDKVELKVERENLVEDEAGIGSDNLYYPVNIVTSDPAFPFTVRIKVGQEFLEQCGDNPIRISKVSTDGSAEIMQDNLTVTEDGYLEVTFPNGLQGTGTATQMLNGGAEGRSITSQEFSFVVSSKTQDDVTLGDVNEDGQVNLVDLMQSLNHVGGKTFLTGNALLAADIDQNGDVDLVDLMRLLNYVGGKTEIL